MGYHADTCASIILLVSQKYTDDDLQGSETEVRKGQSSLHYDIPVSCNYDHSLIAICSWGQLIFSHYILYSRSWRKQKMSCCGVLPQMVYSELKRHFQLMSMHLLKVLTMKNKSMTTYYIILTRRSRLKTVKDFMHR